jgi:hypothetical protein
MRRPCPCICTRGHSFPLSRVQDAREFWETSQSPLVYKLSGAWESLTAPTEEGIAVAAIQKLDPDFILVYRFASCHTLPACLPACHALCLLPPCSIM